MEEEGELRSDSEDGEDGLNGSEELGDENDNEVQDLVEVTVGNVETSSAEELGNNASQLEVHVLELLSNVVGGIVLAQGAVLDLGEGGV